MATSRGHCWWSSFHTRTILVSPRSYLLIEKSTQIDQHEYDRFGWTGFTKDVHWMAPTASGVFVGFGIFSIFLQCFNYLIDSYLTLYVPIPMPIAVTETYPLTIPARLLSSPPIPSSGLLSVHASLSSLARCSQILESNGLARYWDVWVRL